MRDLSLRLGKLELSAGALLGLALLNYMDRDGVVWMLLCSAALHELGHIAAIRALGGRIERMRVTLWGAELRLSGRRPLSPLRDVAAALAGPAANLLLALAGDALARRGAGPRWFLFTAVNLGLCCFNLLPVPRLDGGRALTGLFSLLGKDAFCARALTAIEMGVALLLAVLGAALLWESGNFTLLLAGAWLGAASLADIRRC